jgi:hypothetical protein
MCYNVIIDNAKEPMMSEEKLVALAEEHGIEVEYRAGGVSRATAWSPSEKYAAEILLDAPKGKIFESSGCHCDNSLCHDVETDGTKTNWRRSIEGLKAIIAMGLADCPDGAECDICNDEGDEA